MLINNTRKRAWFERHSFFSSKHLLELHFESYVHNCAITFVQPYAHTRAALTRSYVDAHRPLPRWRFWPLPRPRAPTTGSALSSPHGGDIVSHGLKLALFVGVTQDAALVQRPNVLQDWQDEARFGFCARSSRRSPR